jgi:hypothetical protein
VLVKKGLGRMAPFIWKNERLKWIMVDCTQPTQVDTPMGWDRTSISLSHAAAGGVTSSLAKLLVFYRFKEECIRLRNRLQQKKPSQDLWSFLKVAKPETRVVSGNVPRVPLELVGRVVLLRPGLVCSGGLMLTRTRQGCRRWQKVRTLFGGRYWVDRAMLEGERLQALDLPEQLVHQASVGEVQILVDSELVLLKVLQASAELLSPGLKSTEERNGNFVSSKRKQEFESDGLRDLKSSKLGESLEWEEALEGECNLRTAEDKVELLAPTEGILEKSALVSIDRNTKAAMGDNAGIPTKLWDRYLEKGLSDEVLQREWKGALDPLGRFALVCWKRSIARSLLGWARTVWRTKLTWFKEFKLQVVADSKRCMHACSWWEWQAGLTLFFWNWPAESQLIAWLGIAPWMKHSLKHWKKAQPARKDESI